MKYYKIAEIGKIISGSTPKTDVSEYWNGHIPWVTPKEISELDGPYLKATERKLTDKGYQSCSATLMPKGSILFTSRAPIGLVAISDIEVCTNQGFKSIVLKEGFYPLYIYYILKYNTIKLQDLGTGTTFLELSKSRFEKFEIPIPDLPDQVKIATILSKAEALIKQRTENIDLLDEFLKSIFLKMFGDPVRNERKWEIFQLNDVCNKITDGTHDTPERISTGVKYITGKHITPFNIDFDNSDYVAEEVHKEIYRRTNVEFEDILYTNIGANVGTAARVKVKFEFSLKNVALLKQNRTKLKSHYLEHLLNYQHFKQQLLYRLSVGGAQKFLNLKSIGQIKIPVPPIDLQNHFAEIVEKAEAIKEQFNSSLSDLEKLYGALSQRAFKGELDLSQLSVFVAEEYQPSTNDRDAVPGFKPVYDFETITVKQKGKNKEEEVGEDKRYGDPFEVDEETAKKQGGSFYKQWKKLHTEKKRTKISWDKVSTEQVTNWIKEAYNGFHFTSEMLIRFLMEEHVTFPDYYSSEELKKNPKANDADDLKTLIFSSLNNENPFLKLEQIFYNPETENINLTLRDEDFELIKDRSREERTGVYMRIVR